jgi:hypothetical protein
MSFLSFSDSAARENDVKSVTHTKAKQRIEQCALHDPRENLILCDVMSDAFFSFLFPDDAGKFEMRSKSSDI